MAARSRPDRRDRLRRVAGLTGPAAVASAPPALGRQPGPRVGGRERPVDRLPSRRDGEPGVGRVAGRPRGRPPPGTRPAWRARARRRSAPSEATPEAIAAGLDREAEPRGVLARRIDRGDIVARSRPVGRVGLDPQAGRREGRQSRVADPIRGEGEPRAAPTTAPRRTSPRWAASSATAARIAARSDVPPSDSSAARAAVNASSAVARSPRHVSSRPRWIRRRIPATPTGSSTSPAERSRSASSQRPVAIAALAPTASRRPPYARSTPSPRTRSQPSTATSSASPVRPTRSSRLARLAAPSAIPSAPAKVLRDRLALAEPFDALVHATEHRQVRTQHPQSQRLMRPRSDRSGDRDGLLGDRQRVAEPAVHQQDPGAVPEDPRPRVGRMVTRDQPLRLGQRIGRGLPTTGEPKVPALSLEQLRGASRVDARIDDLDRDAAVLDGSLVLAEQDRRLGGSRVYPCHVHPWIAPPGSAAISTSARS